MSQTAPPLSDELNGLEHEIKILRERYDHLLWSADLIRKFLFACAIVLVPLFLTVALLFLDSSQGTGFVVLGAGLSLLSYNVAKSPTPSFWLKSDREGGHLASFEFECIPGMIAEREARIAEIKKISP